MGINITCESCKASYRVGEQFAGKKAKCPRCQGAIIVPAAAPPMALPTTKSTSVQETPATVARKAQTPVMPPAKAISEKEASVDVIPREKLLHEIRQSFQGEIRPAGFSFTYQLGLFLASIVMLLLMMSYFVIIAMVCYAVYFHAIHDWWIITVIHNGRAMLFALAIYLAPLIAGPALIFFLFKPLFARSTTNIPPVSLKREQEPLLFEFVERVSRAVGAPMPKRIDVDVNVNASAGFRRGLWSMIVGRDLVLTIGLPLVAGMNTRQLAGVLAHEFGHFRQGAGMRMSYLVRRISFWFTKVVYQRDTWDLRLAQMANTDTGIVNLVFYIILGCVWLTRKVLWGLMMLGHLVSGFLLRQMEFDADRFEAQLAGSETFEQTSRKLGFLTLAFRGAIADLRDFYREGRLGDNMPKLLMHNARQMPQDVKEAMEKFQREAKTGIFDTHPCDRDRIAAAKKMNSQGIFQLERPSILLFSNFGTLARQATLTFYREEIGEEFSPDMVHAVDSLVDRQSRDADAVKSLGRFFQGSFSVLRPLRLADDLVELDTTAAETKAIEKARITILAEKDNYEAALKEYAEAESLFTQIEQASALIEANFSFPSDIFSVPMNSYEKIQSALRSAHSRKNGANARMQAMESAVAQRIQIGLRLLQDARLEQKIENIAPLREEISRLLPAQGLLVELFPKLMEYRQTGASLQILLPQLEKNRDKLPLIEAIKLRMKKLHNQLGEILKRLVLVKYPLDHAQANISIADYLVTKLPTDDDLGGLLNTYTSLMEKLPVLYLNLTSRLAAISEQSELALGLPPMLEVPEKNAEGSPS